MKLHVISYVISHFICDITFKYDIICDIMYDIICDIDLPISWVMMSYVKCV